MAVHALVLQNILNPKIRTAGCLNQGSFLWVINGDIDVEMAQMRQLASLSNDTLYSLSLGFFVSLLRLDFILIEGFHNSFGWKKDYKSR